jgi:hypothetical protein
MPFTDQDQQLDDVAGVEADTPEDGRKPKSVPCRYCSKRFRRLEHAQSVSLCSLFVVESFFLVRINSYINFPVLID